MSDDRAYVLTEDNVCPRSEWRLAILTLTVAFAALVAMYWTTAASIVAAWSNDPLGHGYVVVPLACFLVWQRRHQLQALAPRAEFVGLPVIALLAFVWLLGNLADTRVVQQLSWIAMMFALAWVVLGSSVARILIYPLAFLLFALPLGDRFIPMLQDLAARIAVKLLAASGVPVLLQGHIIAIPGGEWRVAEACSGINYLTASMALGYVYAGTVYRDWSHRIGFFVAAALVPLIANGLRVYGTIFIAAKAGLQTLAGTKHYLFGWLVFASMMALLFWICGRWREESPPIGRARAVAAPSATRRGHAIIATAVALFLVAIAPIASTTYPRTSEQAQRTLEPPVASDPWTQTDTKRYGWAPHFESPSAELIREYKADDLFVTLYVAYVATDRARGKLAGASNVLFPPPWSATARRRRSVTVVGGQPMTVNETQIEGGSSSLLVWNWYWVDGTVTSNDSLAQFYLATARLLRRPEGSAAVALATEQRPGLQPEVVLTDFLSHLSLAATLRSSDWSEHSGRAPLHP